MCSDCTTMHLFFCSLLHCPTPDSREESVLGSIPLPSYKILFCTPRECKNRKFTFKVTSFQFKGNHNRHSSPCQSLWAKKPFINQDKWMHLMNDFNWFSVLWSLNLFQFTEVNLTLSTVFEYKFEVVIIVFSSHVTFYLYSTFQT